MQNAIFGAQVIIFSHDGKNEKQVFFNNFTFFLLIFFKTRKSFTEFVGTTAAVIM